MPALLSERKCSKAKRKNNPDKSGTKSGTDSDQERLSQQDYHHHRQERDQEPRLSMARLESFLHCMHEKNMLFSSQFRSFTQLPSRRNGRLAGHEVSISAQACLPADRPSRLCIESIVGAIVVESTKGLEYYCSAPR